MSGWAIAVALLVLALPAGPKPRRVDRDDGGGVAWTQAVGPGAVLAVIGTAPRRWLQRRPDPEADQWWGGGSIAALALAFLWPWGVPAVPAVAAGVRLLLRRRRDLRQRAAHGAALPEVLELVAVAIRAGGTVPAAMALVAERGPTVAAPAFRSVLARMAAGASILEAVDRLVLHLGEGYRPLCVALVSAERDGAPLVGVVAQLAHDAHEARRRAAEARARQVPVRLLLPLVCCTLPAVLVVTIIPLAVVGAGLAD